MGVGVRQGEASAGPRADGRSALALGLKRALDVVAGAVALVLLAPVLAVLALAIAVTEGRPVLFRQQRVGRHGELFTMYKFRTMVPDAHERRDEVAHANERGGPLFKVSEDPRVTRVGRFLRRTSLDELPQLFNVLNGTMSLVGPRPSLPDERAAFPAELLAREDLPQGLTGLWQLDGRHHEDFAVYRDLDLDYVRNWSLGRDLAILLRTPVAVVRHALRGEGAAPAAGDRRPERPAAPPDLVDLRPAGERPGVPVAPLLASSAVRVHD